MKKCDCPEGYVVLLKKLATGKSVLWLFLLTMAVYSLMLFWSMPRVLAGAPEMRLFDMSPSGYSYSQALSLLGALGKTGRAAYLFPQLALDFIYPGLFAACYSLMLVWLFSRRFPLASPVFHLALLPLLAGLADYTENVLIIRMITGFPDISPGLVSAASAATVLKSILTSICLTAVLCGSLLLLKKRTVPPDQGGARGSASR